jgi:thiamine-monophosphate kinase
MTTIGEVGEFALLDRLRPFLAVDGGDLSVGVGDDAAVWQPPLGRAVVVTTDSLVEGQHFTPPLDGTNAVDLGWRLLAISLSDLAAMGARPGPVFLAIALPGNWPVAWVEALYQGVAECASRHAVKVAGGNISAAATAVLTSTCLGSVDPDEVLRRDAAGNGWELAVTGTMGAATASRRAFAAGFDPLPAWRAAARPTPRLEAGEALLRVGVRVAMDVSDGLYVDAARMLAVSAARGLLIDSAMIPLAPGIREHWPRDWTAVAGGGEDYELLFSAPPGVMRRALGALHGAGVAAAVIGRFDDADGLRLLAEGEESRPPASGHEHFAA